MTNNGTGAENAHRLLASVAPGSQADEELRGALETLRDSATDEKLAQTASDILEGRVMITDLLNHSSFEELAAKGQKIEERWLASLSEQDRREYLRKAQELADDSDVEQ